MARDPQRAILAEILAAWFAHHPGQQVTLKELAQPVNDVLERATRSRQDVASYVLRLKGTRSDGYLIEQVPRQPGTTHRYVVTRPGETPTPSAATASMPQAGRPGTRVVQRGPAADGYTSVKLEDL